MPDIQTLWLFGVAALALTLTPGPDMLLIATRSVAQGRAAGFATWAGIALGTYTHALAAAFGLSQLFNAVPVAYDVVRYAGAAYLVYLAWDTFSKNKTIKKSNNKPSVKALSFAVIFRQGYLTNLLNPKMALFVLALFPQFVDLDKGSVALQIMLFATIINVLGFFVNGAVVLFASAASGFLSGNKRVNHFFQNALAFVFLGLAFRLLIDSRS